MASSVSPDSDLLPLFLRRAAPAGSSRAPQAAFYFFRLGPDLPVDSFHMSLAEDLKSKAIAVVLSGMGPPTGTAGRSR